MHKIHLHFTLVLGFYFTAVFATEMSFNTFIGIFTDVDKGFKVGK